MKKIENSFVVTGFVGKDASIHQLAFGLLMSRLGKAQTSLALLSLLHQFTTASVARFSLAISRTEKSGEETNRRQAESNAKLAPALPRREGGRPEVNRTSAFMNVEAWRKNENTSSFDRLVKGALLTVEGYFKPEEWQDAEGVKRNRVILVATKIYEAVEKENAPETQESNPKKGK